MLRQRPAVPVASLSVTLTVPGPVLQPEEVRSLWDRMSIKLNHAGYSCVWRMEVQSRGAAHWHLLLHVRLEEREEQTVCDIAQLRIENDWMKALAAMGPVEYTGYFPPAGKSGVWDITRDVWPRADKHAVVIEIVRDSEAGWTRYMLDHTSKKKQGQVAQGIGRHWGIVGRSLYRVVFPERIVHLTRAQVCALLRIMQKHGRPRIRDERSIFGSRLGWRSSRGRVGRTVWFGGYDKAIDWVIQQGAAL